MEVGREERDCIWIQKKDFNGKPYCPEQTEENINCNFKKTHQRAEDEKKP